MDTWKIEGQNKAKRYLCAYRDGKLYIIKNYSDDEENVDSISFEQTTDMNDNWTTKCGLEFVAKVVNHMIAAGDIDYLIKYAEETQGISEVEPRPATLPRYLYKALEEHINKGAVK